MSEEGTVTIFGSSQPRQGDELYRDACELGRALAEAGFSICNGGYGGTMEASACGAKAGGGVVTGVTCSVFNRSGPNRYLDEVIEADNLLRRLELLIERADAFVVLPGGSGTLVEFALVWELTAKRLIEARPIVLYGDYWRGVVEATAVERPASVSYLTFAGSVQEVVGILRRGRS